MEILKKKAISNIIVKTILLKYIKENQTFKTLLPLDFVIDVEKYLRTNGTEKYALYHMR